MDKKFDFSFYFCLTIKGWLVVMTGQPFTFAQESTI